MLTNPTIDGLHTLKLPGMARGLLEQREHPDYDGLGFEERLGMLVDRELTERRNRRLERMLRSAHLRLSATVEAIDFARPRGLERAQMLSLAESHWVGTHHSVVIVAATGLGKTFLSCALANAAIRRGYSALYLRGPRLHDEIALARADGRLPRLLASWARTDVLVVDLSRRRDYPDVGGRLSRQANEGGLREGGGEIVVGIITALPGRRSACRKDGSGWFGRTESSSVPAPAP